MASERILFVDDDANVRTAFTRSLRGQGFEFDVADGAESAETLAKQHEYAVVATDYRMPEVNGIDVIGKLQQLQPLATYMLVSGECDRDLVLDAVNNHAVGNVLAKPWDIHELREVMRRGILGYFERSTQLKVQHSAVSATRALEELRGSLAGVAAQAERPVIDMLLAILEQRDPEAVAHGRRVAVYARAIAERMGVSAQQLQHLEDAARAHEIGKIVAPDAILRKAGALTHEEQLALDQHPLIAANLLAAFTSLSEVRGIIRQHHERWDGRGPSGVPGRELCTGARIVAVADTFDEVLTGAANTAAGLDQAIGVVIEGSGSRFDPEVVNAFRSIYRQRWLELTKGAVGAPRV